MRSLSGLCRRRFASILKGAGFFCCACLPAAAHAGGIDTLLFGSLDAGAAAFVTVGAKIGLPTLAKDGAAVLASLGGGLHAERGPESTRRRYTALGAVVLGYQWFFDWGVIAAYAGPEASAQMLAERPGPTLPPPRLGLRLHGEVWARPTETTFLQGTVIAGTALDSFWARVALGHQLWDAYLGPEASLYADGTGYRKWNLGLQATDFVVGSINVRVSAGVQCETGRRAAAPYVTLSVWSPW